MGKRRTKFYSPKMYSFLCSRRPPRNYALTFSDGRYGSQKQKGLAELWPSLFFGLPSMFHHFIIYLIFKLKLPLRVYNFFRIRQIKWPFDTFTVNVLISQLLSTVVDLTATYQYYYIVFNSTQDKRGSLSFMISLSLECRKIKMLTETVTSPRCRIRSALSCASNPINN